ncbi:hypothetical protein N8467_00885 [bacterium]|jgi:hypothetical protein|nr:hypothetical protein [bacterium]
MKLRNLIVIPLLALMSCETASNLVFEPEPSDPLDGYEGSLAQAGINTDMDWGPKQSLLLDKYKTLLETHSQLKKDHEESLRINQNLQSQLHSEQAALTQEKSSRAQSEAETERLRQRNRDHEAKILSLSIEKAKLEQTQLRALIADLQETVNAQAAEATATPQR